jgi:hypothetical protein
VDVNAKNATVLAMLGGVPDQPTPEAEAPQPTVPSFDGGARQTPPLPPESHNEWLARTLRGKARWPPPIGGG